MGQRLDAENLLDLLETPTNDQYELVSETRKIFLPAFEAVSNLYIDVATGKTSGTESFAIRALLTRSFNDLIVSFHLFRQGYELQGNAVARTILESLDLIELFFRQPEYAAIFAEGGPKAWSTLRPKAVRKLLNKESADEVFSQIYSHLSEMGGHPSFEGLRRTTYKKTDGGPVTLTLGAQRFEHSFVFGFGFCFLLLGTVFAKVAGLTATLPNNFEYESEVKRVSDIVINAFLHFLDLSKPFSDEHGLDTTKQQEVLAALRQQLGHPVS